MKKVESNSSLKMRAKKTLNAKHAQSFNLQQMTFVYVLLIASLALATTLYYSVTRKAGNKAYFYEILYILLFGLSIIVLLFLFVYIRKKRNQVQQRDDYTLEMQKVGCRLSDRDLSHFASQEEPCLHFGGEGFNLYLRLGLLLFCVFGVIYNIIRIVSEFENNFSVCGNGAYILFCLLQATFVVCQTVFILINHKIIFLSDKPIIRLCLSHLLVVNVSLWIHSGIGEISEGVSEVLNEEGNATFCDMKESTVSRSRPFMLPALIEYSLLGAPMILEILAQVGKRESLEESKVNEKGDEESDPEKYPPLHKAKRGSGFGLLAVIICVLSILCFYLLQGSEAVIGLSIYHVEDTVFNVLIIICGSLAYVKFRQLKFMSHTEGKVDEYILWMSLFGTLFYHLIILSKSLDTLEGPGEINHTTRGFILLEVIMSFLTIISSSFQTVVIINAMHRIPDHEEHIHNKPGRPYITILLFINFCLWILDTFEVKKSELAFSVTKHSSTSPHEGIVDVRTSTALLHVALPVTILFRFHSSVCLSCIWTKSYALE